MTFKLQFSFFTFLIHFINFEVSQTWAKLDQVGPSCWGHVGTRLGQVGVKLNHIGPISQLGTNLGPGWVNFCVKLGPSWARVGPAWDQNANWGQTGLNLPTLKPNLFQIASIWSRKATKNLSKMRCPTPLWTRKDRVQEHFGRFSLQVF